MRLLRSCSPLRVCAAPDALSKAKGPERESGADHRPLAVPSYRSAWRRTEEGLKIEAQFIGTDDAPPTI